MDNITHTFVGAALAEAGLKRRTALGAATLMIGANFPDIDVVAVAFPGSIDIRRGVTHGFLAHLILPFVLAWLVLLYDRRVRLRRDPDAAPADFRQLALLSAIAIATHPMLDFMNIYGMRWLMPFVNRWFYADGLFIIDAWMLGALVLGFVWSRRVGWARPARIALLAVAAYVPAMLAITTVSRADIGREYPGLRFMAGPSSPFAPWRREFIVDDGDVYRFGSWSLLGRRVETSDATLATEASTAAALAARRAPEARGFLNWARFPFYRVATEGSASGSAAGAADGRQAGGVDGATVVRIADARFTGPSGFGWASVAVRVPTLPRQPESGGRLP